MLMNNNKVNFIGPEFPTFLSHNAATTPDIVLTNNKTFHNISLKPGPVTPSDHIPIIIKITTKAITIPTIPKININKTNWEIFKEDIATNIININTDPTMTNTELDNATERWTDTITQSLNNNTPKSHHKTIQKSITSDNLKLLRQWAKNLLVNCLL